MEMYPQILVRTLLFRRLHAMHAVLTHLRFEESSCDPSFFLRGRGLDFDVGVVASTGLATVAALSKMTGTCGSMYV